VSDHSAARPLVAGAHLRLRETAASLPDEAYAGPSLCPGWTRGHVLAHLALNAEGLGGVLRGVTSGVPTPMYASPERRDTDIDDLVAAGPHAVRERLAPAVASFEAALAALPTTVDQHEMFERTPGHRHALVSEIGVMRLREVEIHHADLDAGYHHPDWPRDVAEALLEFECDRYDGPPLVLHATDLRVEHDLYTEGPGAPTVTGTGAALAWWMSGRSAEGLTCDQGELPGWEKQ